jgi:DNA-binding transcriptional MerR regulator
VTMTFERGPHAPFIRSLRVPRDESRRAIAGGWLRRRKAPLHSSDAARLAGISYKKLDHWCRLGLLRPGQNFLGSGSNREWPAEEVEVARRMGILTAAGLSLKTAHDVARSGHLRTELAPGVRLMLGPALSDACDRDDCEGCFPDEPADCGHGCHDDERGA